MVNRSTNEINRRARALALLAGLAALSSVPYGPPSSLAAEPAASGKPAAKPAAKATLSTMPVKPKVTPQHIVVQHILIGFVGSVQNKEIKRSKEEAKQLAMEILGQARKGADFDALVTKYTDDSPPGIYGLANLGVPVNPQADPPEYPRNNMVAAFGNVGFSMRPGNIGIAEYDPQDSPYGWHIIKRLK